MSCIGLSDSFFEVARNKNEFREQINSISQNSFCETTASIIYTFTKLYYNGLFFYLSFLVGICLINYEKRGFFRRWWVIKAVNELFKGINTHSQLF